MLTIAEADALILGLPSGTTTAAWGAATNDKKQIALGYAIASFDAQSWRGTIASKTQANSWPRVGEDCQGRTFPDASAPAVVLSQLALLAAANVQDESALGTVTRSTSAQEAGKIIKKRTDKVASLERTTEYFEGSEATFSTGLPDAMSQALSCYLNLSSVDASYGLLFGSSSVQRIVRPAC